MMMTTFRNRPGVAVLDGKLYVCGGHTDEGPVYCDYDYNRNPLNSVEVFDPELNKWKSIASMNKTRANFGLTAFQGKLYAAGGNTSPYIIEHM